MATSKRMYEVVSYLGDYAVEHQPNWTKEFDNLAIAKAAAREQHKKLRKKWKSVEFHTVVQSDDGMRVHFAANQNTEYNGTDAQKFSDTLMDYPREIG